MKRKSQQKSLPVVIKPRGTAGLSTSRTLTEDSINFVRTVLEAGTSGSTKRVYRSHLNHFWMWANEALGLEESYPVETDVIVRFIADHLGKMDPVIEKRLIERGAKNRPGPLSLSTVKVRLVVLGMAHRSRDLESPCSHKMIRKLLTSAARNPALQPKGKMAITTDILKKLLRTCGTDIRGVRDRAILLTGFSSGGRRRSELAAFEYRHLRKVEGGYILKIARSKTDQAGVGHDVPVLGAAAKAVERWLRISKIKDGKLFRSIGRDGSLLQSICDRQINRIVKKRLNMIGIDSAEFGAHSLRSGFVTSAARDGVSLPMIMEMTGHKTLAIAARYVRPGEIINNPAARLVDKPNVR
jgi:integrase